MVRSYCFLLVLVALMAQAKEPDVEHYIPGKLITADRYATLSGAFFERWEKHATFEAEMKKANDEVEPEALSAGLKILSSSDSKVTYANFTPRYFPQNEEIASHDGLLGFRVVRQLELENDGKKRLLSSIQTFDWDDKLSKMVPTGGVDSFRVRVQVDEFQPSENRKAARGFVGFSWTTMVDKDGRLSKIEGRNNVTDDKKKWLTKGHQGSYDPHGGPCSWTTHCNVCHHATERSAISNFKQAPLEKRGAQAFLKYLKEERKFSKEKIESVAKVLADPKTAFPIEPLKKALLARWHELNSH